MRILASTTAGTGHFLPMAPIVSACRQAGHEVLVACPDSFVPVVAEQGFAVEPFADAPPAEFGAVMSGLPGMAPDEANRIVVGEVFGRIDTTAALPRLAATMARWQPDVVIRDPVEFASWVLAERSGVPTARVSIGLLDVDRRFAPAAADALGRLPAAGGLSVDPPALAAGLAFAAAPSTFDPEPAIAQTVVRYAEPASGVHDVPAAVPEGDEPLVYVTFGTVAASLGVWPGMYRAVIDGLADLPVRVLVTTGRGPDPSELEPLPPRVAVAAFVPQAAVLRHAALAVVHGGFGTVLGALRAGVPMVVAPLFADQPYNAARVAATGVGTTIQTSLDPGAVPPGMAGEVRAAVLHLLDDPAPRRMAAELAEEMAAHPPVADLVPVIESLVPLGSPG